MRTHVILLLLLAAVRAGAAPALEERRARELTCLPVNGYIELPGIAYDDMTPLAREVFQGDAALATNALYALAPDEREDFIDLYLEPAARERHRYFFARCREASRRRAEAALVDGGETIPKRLREELRERERVRLALHDGAIPFLVGGRTVRIPLPAGYAARDEAPPAARGMGGALAVFEKIRAAAEPGGTIPPPDVFAVVRQVREGTESLGAMLAAYRVMVDENWRLTGLYPPEARPEEAETVEYKWNLAPFAVRDGSFCYGRFEKTRDFHGVERVRYGATAMILLHGRHIQVSIAHNAESGLDAVGEINADLAAWRDAIAAANYRTP